MENKKEFKRSLGLIDATSIVSGSMIGSGIFIVTTYMARDIGSSGWMLVLWLLTGIITVMAALSYGELAAMMPKAGGQYVYIQRAYGHLASFLYGWVTFSVIQTGVIAAVAVAFAKYTCIFFPELSSSFTEIGTLQITYAQLLSIFSILFLTYVNSRGVKHGKNVQLVFTSAKLIALFALIVLGLSMGLKSEVMHQNFTDMWKATQTVVENGKVIDIIPLTGFALAGALGATIINPLFSSDAWNNVTFIAGEIKDPVKNIPRSLFLGTLIVTVLYLLANLAYMALLPITGNPDGLTIQEQGIMFSSNDRVGTAAASVIFGNSAGYIMAALIMISTFGCNNGLILSGARLFYAMSKDGLFFKKAARLNEKQVPAIALWLQTLWACVLCVSGKYNQLLEYATFVSLLFYILTISGVFVLRKKEPHTHRPYKIKAYPYLPALYIVISLAICIDLIIYKPYTTLLGLLLVVLGIPVYYYTRYRERKDSQ